MKKLASPKPLTYKSKIEAYKLIASNDPLLKSKIIKSTEAHFNNLNSSLKNHMPIISFNCSHKQAREILAHGTRNVSFFSIVPGEFIEHTHPFAWDVPVPGHYYHAVGDNTWCTGPFPNIYAAKAHALENEFEF